MEDATASALPSASPALWLLSFLIACAAGHLLTGHVRHARREAQAAALRQVRSTLLGALGFGSGVTAAMALAIASQAPAYVYGYLALGAGASGAAAVAAAAVSLPLLMRWPGRASVAVSALLLGAGTVGGSALLVRSLGLLPGLDWSLPTLAAGAALSAAVTAAGLWTALLGPGQAGRHRRAWRMLAALVLGGSIVLAQQFVLAAGDFATQVASAYRGGIGSTLMAVAAAAGVPALLGAMLIDLHLRDAHLKLDASHRRRRRSRTRPARENG